MIRADLNRDEATTHLHCFVIMTDENGRFNSSRFFKINQKVGFRFLTKFGTKGLINIGKAIPVVGGVISGGFDFAETKIIADRAYKMFILGDFSSPKKKGDDTEEDIIEVSAEDFVVVDTEPVEVQEVQQ